MRSAFAVSKFVPHVLAAGLAIALAGCGAEAKPDHTAQVERGQYLVGLMSCTDCHTPGYFKGAPKEGYFLAGSDVGFEIPGLGYFYGRNLTPDNETGLGTWSADQIVTTMRTGVRPDGRVLSPNMPWRAFASLTDQDAYAIAAYLKSLKPVHNEVPPVTGAAETAPAPYLAVTMPVAKTAAAAPAAPAAAVPAAN